MGRKRESSFFDELYEHLVKCPTWVGPVFAGLAYVLLRWGVPLFLPVPNNPDHAIGKTLNSVIGRLSVTIAPWVVGCILVVWLAAESKKWSNRNRLDLMTGIDSIHHLGWLEFEELLAEAYRRQGYVVEHIGGNGPDGGVDLRLIGKQEIVLVQCKHWQVYKVGVAIIRELFGVVTSEGASSGVVVTSGEFTPDAIAFARKVSITLIAGRELCEMIGAVQRQPRPVPPVPSPPVPPPLPRSPTACPTCGSPMILRTARKGPNIGSQFWGCSHFPNCRTTRPATS